MTPTIPNMDALTNLISAAGVGGFALWLAYYLITKAMPRLVREFNETIKSVTTKCEDAAARKDAAHESTVKHLTDSFIAEIKIERAERKEELLVERKRMHDTRNELHVERLATNAREKEMTEILQELATVVKDLTSRNRGSE